MCEGRVESVVIHSFILVAYFLLFVGASLLSRVVTICLDSVVVLQGVYCLFHLVFQS